MMRAPRPTPEIPAAYVQAIRNAYAARGMDPTPTLMRAGVTQGQPASLRAFEDLSEYAMRELDDEALGWFSRRLPWGSYGMLLRASLTSPDLDIALRRWARHHGLMTDDISIDTAVEGPLAVIGITERADLGVMREFALVSVLRNIHGIACWLADSRIALSWAAFPFAAPEHADVFDRMFPGRVSFDARRAAIAFDAAYLRLAVVRSDESLRRRLQKAIPLMARQYRQDRLLSHRVLQLLTQDAGRIDAPQLAAHLGISTRSLQRHLQDEGTSLVVLRGRARRQMAQDLLRGPVLPIKRIAHQVGYDSESSFTRAFRGWTGQTPVEYRDGARGGLG